MGTREIPLTQGHVALVDDEDYVWLSQWNWCAAKRREGTVRFVPQRHASVAEDPGRRTIYMARAIMGLAHADPRQVDHVNFDRLDNRRSNLRIVSRRSNKQHQPSRGGTSRFVGISACSSKWRAVVGIDGRQVYLGDHATELVAAVVRDRYVIEHGTAHHLNVPKVCH
jgi:hypothetical protein